MASENNKSNSVAVEADASADENTSELEVLSMDLIPTEEELEMDAKTFSLDIGEQDIDSVAALQSDLRSKDERISNLQFDIEQLRARWTGLEKEISAREELTDLLQADLKSANEALAAKDELLAANEGQLSSLSNKLADSLEAADAAAEKVAELERVVAEHGSQSERDAALIENLEIRLQEAEDALPPDDDPRDEIIAETRLAVEELNTYIDGRKRDWDEQSTELESTTVVLRERSALVDKQSAEIEAAKSKLRDAEAKIEHVTADVKAARAQVKEQSIELRKTKARLSELHETELQAEQQIAKQRGALADSRQKVAALESHVARADKYADELRAKLCNSFEKANTASDTNALLEKKLSEAHAEVGKLQEHVNDEEDRNRKLRNTNEVLKRELDEEIGNLRSQLGDARQAISGQETINEKLKTDLTENKAFKKLLEDQLTAYEESHADELQQLRGKVSELEEQLSDSQRKIANKDKAVAALLSELANKTKTIESIDEIENAIHDIDNRMSKRIDDRSGTDRERPTRLLIGNIDGQKLRFPLFKDRLTIGRTVQNDIQIRAQFISRRHAVLVTDSEGTKIIDWGSKNGIYVNKTRIAEQQLRSGDSVTIGAVDFVYEELARRPD